MAINKHNLDLWSAAHFIGAIIIAYIILFYTNNIASGLILGTIIVLLWECFEYVLKKYYDMFNIPFGRKTVLESSNNTAFDIIAGELGIVTAMIFYFFI